MLQGKLKTLYEWIVIHQRNRLTINIWSFTPRALSPGEEKNSHNRSYYASSSIKCKKRRRELLQTLKTSRYWFFMCSSNFSFLATGEDFSSSTFSHISSSHIIVVLWSLVVVENEKKRKFLLNMRLDFRQHERHIFQYVKWPDHFEEFQTISYFFGFI